MNFKFSRNNLDFESKFYQRVFEILPGFLSLASVSGLIFTAIYKPFIGSVIVMALSIYIIVRIFYLKSLVGETNKRLSMDAEFADWNIRAKGLNGISEYLRQLYYADMIEANSREAKSVAYHKAEISVLRQTKDLPMRFDDVYHCLIIPLSSGSQNLLDEALESITLSYFPPQKIFVILALDSNVQPLLKDSISKIAQSYTNDFLKLQIVQATKSRGLVVSEKALAINSAINVASEFFKSKSLPLDNVITTFLDLPRVMNSKYFAGLTYFYMASPNRTKLSFQPIASFSQDFAKSPTSQKYCQVSALCFKVPESTNPRELSNFLPSSMSLSMLIDLGCLPTDVVSFKAAFSWKAFLKYGDTYEVAPVYVRENVDIANLTQSTKLLSQNMSHDNFTAREVENFPILMRGLLKSKQVPLASKLKCAFVLLEKYFFYGLWPFILTFFAWLPIPFLFREFSKPVYYFSIPQIKGRLILLGIVGFVSAFILITAIVPKAKGKQALADSFKKLPQLVMGSLGTFFKSSLIYILAQVRLMFGSYN